MEMLDRDTPCRGAPFAVRQADDRGSDFRLSGAADGNRPEYSASRPARIQLMGTTIAFTRFSLTERNVG